MQFIIGDDICALSTANGSAALAVVRCSGPNTLKKLSEVFKRDLLLENANSAKFARFYDGDAVLDETVLAIFKAPKTFTGEDVAEISFHGSPFVVTRALTILADSGFRMAQGGEFSFRAFSNGKMDLSQTEAISDLIASENEASHKLAMNQLRGGYSQLMNTLRDELIHFASLIELELDFSEEDVEFANRPELIALLNKVIDQCHVLCDSFRMGNAIKKGVPVAIIGKPNAGKSTLLNALLKDERAIVSDIAGTTRDTVEDTCTINGVGFRFIDTAGLRESTDVIEQEGIRRSKVSIDKADVILALYDASANNTAEELQFLHDAIGNSDAQIIYIANKCDKKENLSIIEGHLPLSAKGKTGMDDLEHALVESVNDAIPSESAFTLSNVRHYAALKQCAEALTEVIAGLELGIPGDLIAIDIRRGIAEIGSITGEITTDDLLGNIFSKFCIGK